jgi:hypothetical protein
MHFSYWDGQGQTHTGLGSLDEVEDMADFIEQRLDYDTVIGAAGAEVDSSPTLVTPTGKTLNPDTVHCIVFYDDPGLDPLQLRQNMEFRSNNHKKSALEAVEGESLGTAILSSGGDISGAQIDYWPQHIDKQTGDYGELDWSDPGEV